MSTDISLLEKAARLLEEKAQSDADHYNDASSTEAWKTAAKLRRMLSAGLEGP